MEIVRKQHAMPERYVSNIGRWNLYRLLLRHIKLQFGSGIGGTNIAGRTERVPFDVGNYVACVYCRVT
jgi:hypothetical protein